VIGALPVLSGAVHVSVTSESPPLPVGAPGAPGEVTAAVGVAAAEIGDAGPAPTEFTALTRNSYAVPFVSPVTVAAVVVETPSSKVDQSIMPTMRYSIA